MPQDAVDMETGDGSPAAESEQVWTALLPDLNKLRDDVVCITSDVKLKNELKKKFSAHGPLLKQTFLSKMEEVLKVFQPGTVPAGTKRLVEVNTRDIRENLVGELVDSLETLAKAAKDAHYQEDFNQALDDKLAFLSRKAEASIDGFEANFAHRYQKQAGTNIFGPMDFNRESLEDDPLASSTLGHHGSPIDDYEKLQRDLAGIERKAASLEKELKRSMDEAADKSRRIVELNQYLRTCDSMSTVLGCNPADLQKQVHELLSATEHQNSKIDDLQSQLSNYDSLQDHTECNRRISELQAQLDYKDIELRSEVQRVDLLSKTVRDLRDELHKKGIGQSLEGRLRQLGFLDGSSADVGSSASSASFRYGSRKGVHKAH